MSTGLEIAERYYKEIGRPMLEAEFPELLPRLAAGLAGEGSECFGFDDDISRDHDFGAGFCLWLTEEDFSRYGEKLQAAYDRLPGLPDIKKRRDGRLAGKRVGVFSAEGWVASFLGKKPPFTFGEWTRLPEERLACCVNGRVFEDGAGVITALRREVGYYPEPVRVYRIVSAASDMGQSGQYNFSRCMRRGDTVAAYFAKAEFLKAAVHMLFLLNGVYEPYYKWAFRGLAGQKRVRGAQPLMETLASLPVTEETGEETAQLIERVCELVIAELQREELTESRSDFLIDHLDFIASNIERRQP